MGRQMKEIQLTRGFITCVDNEDFGLACVGWHYSGGYAVRRFGHGSKFLHLEILKWMYPSLTIEHGDHKDRNKLNNCRSNLRPCSKSLDAANRPPRTDNTTGYRGVVEIIKDLKYSAKCKGIWLGYFNSKTQSVSPNTNAIVEHHV